MDRRRSGILAGDIDLDARRGGPPTYPPVTARPGMVVVERSTGAKLRIVAFGDNALVATDALGVQQRFQHLPGLFAFEGRPVTLVPPRGPAESAAPRVTASGSVAGPKAPARVARGSRILVEGVHDAELLERVWGDDLRHEGVVVERLDGLDHLDAWLRAFRPAPGRRVGVLVDHLVAGSKEARIAADVRDAHVLVTGHPYVDVWEAVSPSAVGIDAWPVVPLGTPWKEGVCAALGVGDPRAFWKQVLRSVRDWRDLQTPLVTAVETLIDFVAEGEA